MALVLHQKTDGNCCFTKLLQAQGEENGKLTDWPFFLKAPKVELYKDAESFLIS